jgi:hypothetical protein
MFATPSMRFGAPISDRIARARQGVAGTSRRTTRTQSRRCPNLFVSGPSAPIPPQWR